MELFAVGLKAEGALSSRTLSYAGAKFEVRSLAARPLAGLGGLTRRTRDE